jgi:dipeptidyl aminopeptidase/acylaminoacyl peptidase
MWTFAAGLRASLFFLCTLGLVPTHVQAQNTALNKPPPAADFFQHAAFSGAQLSPSGKLLAFRVGAPGARDRLAVLNLDTDKVQAVAAFEDADVARFHWVNDTRLVFDVQDSQLAQADQRLAPGLFAVNADGQAFRQLVERQKVWVRDGIANRQLPWNTFLLDQRGNQDSDSVWVVQPEDYSLKGADYFKLLRLNTVTGLAEEIDTPLNAFQWLLDAKGQLRAVQTLKGNVATLRGLNASTGQWEQLAEFDRFGFNRPLRLLGAAADGKFYAVSNKGRDTDALFTFDPATRTLSDKPLMVSAEYDLAPNLIKQDGKLLGVHLTADAQMTQWLDEGMKTQQAALDKRLPDTVNLLSPPARSGSPWLLVRAYSDVQPERTYVFNSQTQKLTALGGQQPHIKPAQMSGMDVQRFKARDGLEIPVYLTLPKNAAVKKNLPLIVYVHGGPWVRGGQWHWQGDVQFLASRGYAVLQPEFRGSTGYGAKHFRASFKQWGLTMQDDLADAARWAIKEGVADPQRICIMGASYGGYATLMGLAKDGELFKCGVQWVGVSDILLMYDARWSDMSDEWKRYGMPAMIGDREKDAAQLAATSPINLAARIKNPLLMAHGRVDNRVPIEHGRRMLDALKANNAPVEWIEYPKDGHGWALPETQVDWWTRVESFLARSIPPAAGAK